jgi:hypothetical protein
VEETKSGFEADPEVVRSCGRSVCDVFGIAEIAIAMTTTTNPRITAPPTVALKRTDFREISLVKGSKVTESS